jgi:hypothetical protein
MGAKKQRSAPEPTPPTDARWVALTQGKFALVDEEDFELVSRFTWCFSAVKDRPDVGYAKTRDNETGRQFRLHQLVLGFPSHMIDHINRDRLDCRKKNLRAATGKQNQGNREGSKNNTSGYRGVYWHVRDAVWRAQIMRNKKQIGLGTFQSAEDAARAYDRAAREHFGDFARVNFPQTGGDL